jgi:hypothetical protein
VAQWLCMLSMSKERTEFRDDAADLADVYFQGLMSLIEVADAGLASLPRAEKDPVTDRLD